MSSLDQYVNSLRAAAESTRIRLLVILSHNELTVSEITEITQISQPRVSRHLKLMCDGGLLDRVQEGAWVFYRVSNQSESAGLVKALLAFIPEQDLQIQSDLKRVEMIRGRHAKRAKDFFEKNAGDWDKIRKIYFNVPEVEQCMIDAVKGMQIDDMLDLGTGTGRMLEVFSPYIKRGMGIDHNQQMLNIARSQLEENNINHCQVRSGDINQVSLPNSSVDLITIHHVLHFLNDPKAVLQEAARLLKPKGKLIVVDFSPHDNEFFREEYAHRRLGFSDKEIKQWIEPLSMKLKNIEMIVTSQLKKQGLAINVWIIEPDI